MRKHPEIRSAAEAFADDRAKDPLRDFFTVWDDVTTEHVVNLRTAVESARREEDLQAHLQAHPLMLVQHLGGGHGRWVIPKPRLESEYVPDFVIGDRDSGGRRWTAVELEGPTRPMFTKGGDPSRYLSHAIRQLMDWRSWLTANRAYASAPRDEEGLGLEDIDPRLPGLIIMGRRDLGPNPRGLRRQLEQDHRLEIHSYDWLIERAEGRVRELERHHASLRASSTPRTG